MWDVSLFIEQDISDKKQKAFFLAFVFDKNFCQSEEKFNVWHFLINVRS